MGGAVDGKALKSTPKPYVKMVYKSRGIAAVRSTMGEKKQICQVGGKPTSATNPVLDVFFVFWRSKDTKKHVGQWECIGLKPLRGSNERCLFDPK